MVNLIIFGYVMLFYVLIVVLDKDNVGISGFNGRVLEVFDIDNGIYSGVFRNIKVFREYVWLYFFDFLEIKFGVVFIYLVFEYVFNLCINIIWQDNEWIFDIVEKVQNIFNQEFVYIVMLFNVMDFDLGVFGDDEILVLEDKFCGLNDVFFVFVDMLILRVDNCKVEEVFVVELDIMEDEIWIGWDQYNSQEILDDYCFVDCFYYYIVSLRVFCFNVYEIFIV